MTSEQSARRRAVDEEAPKSIPIGRNERDPSPFGSGSLFLYLKYVGYKAAHRFKEKERKCRIAKSMKKKSNTFLIEITWCQFKALFTSVLLDTLSSDSTYFVVFYITS